MSFTVVKQADGVYRWYSISSNNALDRDDEIVSRAALEMDVHRTKVYGDTSELYIFHLPYRLGGAPDFRAVVDGFLVETGEFDNTPVSETVAKFILERPGGTDGSGWGTSIGFKGYPDKNSTYDLIRIKERSPLPLSKAANPYTYFNLEEVDSMPLTKSQQEFLALMASDPEAREAAKMILAASEQSKAIDEAGVKRKDATEPDQVKDITSTNAQYVNGPDGIANTPGVAKDADGDSDGDSMKCTKCSHVKSSHGADGCSVDGCKCSGMSGKAMAEGVEESSSKAMAEAIAGMVETHVKAMLQAEVQPILNGMAAAIIGAITPVAQRVEQLEKIETAIKAQHETPRLMAGVIEQLKHISASRADATLVDENDDLAKAADAVLEDEPATPAALFGFNPTKRGN